MQDRSLITEIYEGYQAIKEFKATEKYKQTSDIYKKALIASKQEGVDPRLKNNIDSLANAKNFAEMINIAKRMDPTTQSLGIQLLAKSFAFFGAYVNSTANLAYYAFQLKSDIVKYAVENNFPTEDKETKKEYSYTP